MLGEMTDVDKIMHPQHFGTDPADIRIRIRLIRKSRFESRITFGSKFGVGERLCSLSALVVVVVVVTFYEKKLSFLSRVSTLTHDIT